MNVDEYTIEHILPQNPNLSKEWQTMLGEDWKTTQETYLHTLGNLTLTGYNSELSDHPFSKKKTMEGGFDDSPIRLNSLLKNTDVWNEAQILSRAEVLALIAKQIWYVPDSLAVLLSKIGDTKSKQTNQYSLDTYEYLQGDMLNLYEHLKKRILNIDSSVTEEYKKIYIAFKSSTNFVDIVPQKARLRLSLNMSYGEIHDPKNLCKDVSGLGRWGNGEIEVGLAEISEIDDVMELIQQSFDSQN